MIQSIAVISIRKGHDADVIKILSEYIEKEKKNKGCLKAYFRKALDNDDTFLAYAEYDSIENFKASEKASAERLKEGGKVESALRPHILKAFYGNFD